MFFKQLRIAATVLILMTILTGIFYPFAITGLAKLFFLEKANGSMIVKNDKLIGSELIGQQFTDPKYFWGRLSATSLYPYNAGASAGSNYGQNNPELYKSVEKRIQDLKTADPHNKKPIPVDLVTASSSGLDPHISVASALYQVERIARIRGIEKQKILFLITQNEEGRTLGLIGEPRVNVLQLNLALDETKKNNLRK